MATISLTTTDIDGLFKRAYENYRVKLFPVLTPLLANLKKGGKGGSERMRWSAGNLYWDVVLGRAVGASSSTAGALPPSASAQEKQASTGITRTYVTRDIDGLAIRATQASKGAFIPLVKKVTEEAMDASRMYQQEILHGAGTGVKALVTTVNTTTEIEVESPYGVSGAGKGSLLLGKGQFVTVRDATAAWAILGSAEITAITVSGDTATLTLGTAIADMAAGDAVVAANSATDDSYNAVADGLIKVTNRGGSAYVTLNGLSGTTYPRWDATRMTAGTDTPDASQPSEMDIYDLILRVANISGKSANDAPGEFLLVTTPGIAKKLGESFLGQRQWDMKESVTLNGGFKAVKVCGLPLIQDFYCPAGTLYLIHKNSLAFVDLQDFQKLSFEGEGSVRPISGYDAYQLTWGMYWNIATIQRNAHGSITGYTDSVRYDHGI